MTKKKTNIPKAVFNAKIEWNAYQYDAFIKFYRQEGEQWIPKGNHLLIKDEVGVGKTIEVGIILKQFVEYKKNARILIVVPSAFLCKQWHHEMKELFYLDFYDYKNQSCDNFKYFERVICTSNDLKEIAQMDKRWDLLIIDEGHNYRNEANSFNNLEKISSKTDYVIVLSATFVVNSEGDKGTIFKLFPVNEKVKQKNGEEYGDYLFTENKKYKVFCLDKLPEIEEWEVELSKDEKEIYKEIKEQIRNNAIYNQMLASSITVFSSMAKGEEYNEVNEEELQGEKNTIDVEVELKEDSKLNKLVEEIGKMRKKPDEYGYGIVIFSRFLDVCSYLEEKLSKELGKTYEIINIGERGISRSSVNYRIQQFKNKIAELEGNSNKRVILITSDRIREGVNLQCVNVLINYDLPFTAAEISQRIGRIDRKGQTRTPHVFHMLLKGEYADREILKNFVNLKNVEGDKFYYNITQETNNAFKEDIKKDFNLNSDDDGMNHLKEKLIKNYREKEEKILKEFGIVADDSKSEDTLKLYVQSGVAGLLENLPMGIKFEKKETHQADKQCFMYSLRLEDTGKEKALKVLLRFRSLAQELQSLFVDYDLFLREQGIFYSYSELKNQNWDKKYFQLLKSEIKFGFRIFHPEEEVQEYRDFLPLDGLNKLISYIRRMDQNAESRK